MKTFNSRRILRNTTLAFLYGMLMNSASSFSASDQIDLRNYPEQFAFYIGPNAYSSPKQKVSATVLGPAYSSFFLPDGAVTGLYLEEFGLLNLFDKQGNPTRSVKVDVGYISINQRDAQPGSEIEFLAKAGRNNPTYVEVRCKPKSGPALFNGKQTLMITIGRGPNDTCIVHRIGRDNI